ncbi:MAG: heparan-alpha-glucosaminide N-acetyltransferase [Candidatus Micrarchaeota archaeon]
MKRFLEVDALRGIAIIMVVAYHAVFDLHFFGVLPGLLPTGEWLIFGHIAAVLFVLLAGFSLHLSMSRAKLHGKMKFSKYLPRGAQIFALGMLITLATWIYPHEGVVIFGVLHLIGAAIVLGYFFERFYLLNAIFGAAIVLFGLLAGEYTAANPALFFLGFPISGLFTLDYFPLAPWFGVFLIGMFLGKMLYPQYERRFDELQVRGVVARALGVFGRNTLLIYFVHQPIIILGLSLFGVVRL